MRRLFTLALGMAVGGLTASMAWAGASDMPAINPAGYSQPPIPPATQPNATQPMPASPAPRANDVYDNLQPPAANCGCDFGNCFSSGWFAEVDGLVMTRNQPNKYWTTYDQTNNNFQNLNTEMANVHWDGGVDVTLGYRFCCECGIEAQWWGIGNMNGSCSIYSATNNLGTPMDTTNGAGNLLLGGQPPDLFFANASQVYIWRHDDVNNVEINYLWNPGAADTYACAHATWLAGFRLFRFNENLLWTTVASGFTYGSGGGVNQANLDIQCENLLAGAQIGAHFDWRIYQRLSMTFSPEIGIYGNHAENDCHYYRGDGVNGFEITGSKDTVSFIGQVDLGLKYDFATHWSVVGGYRVLVATGLALSDNQIPHFLAAADEFADVKVNSDLVLHGVYAGVQCTW